MAGKNLKRASRYELLGMLYEMQKSNEELSERLKVAEARLEAIEKESPEQAEHNADGPENAIDKVPDEATALKNWMLNVEAQLQAIQENGTQKTNGPPDPGSEAQNAIQEEMSREKTSSRFRVSLKSTVGTLIVVLAIAVLVAGLLLPVIQLTGTSMQPTFQPGEIIVAYKTNTLEPGDICTFYYNNKLIVKRVIASGGDSVDIDENGLVSVNGRKLDETYVSELALGQCDLEFPMTVPNDTFFVLGDNRADSVDSRSSEFGCIGLEEMVGKIFLRVWPINAISYFGM